MEDLTGNATERAAQLSTKDDSVDASWLNRQLVSALNAWQEAEDELRMLREARIDY